jgi:hypothetical protein
MTFVRNHPAGRVLITLIAHATDPDRHPANAKTEEVVS